jgi:tight adherence protein B
VPDLVAKLGPDALIVLGGGGGVMLLLLLLGFTMVLVLRPRARLKNRMVALGLTPGGQLPGARSIGSGARQRRVQERLREFEAKGKQRARRREMRGQLMQAGLSLNLRNYFLISAAVGLLAAVGYLLSGYPPIGAPPVALFAGIMLPRWGVRFLARRRQKLFTKHFPNAIDVLVRGIRTGLPVGECLAIIGREAPAPVGDEFRLMVEGQRLGMSLDELLRRGLERIPTAEYKFFAIVLQIQSQTGGNLAETLENLSRVIRERKKLRDKVKALSAEAKASAMIIGSLPLFVMVSVQVMTPNYLVPLFTESVGQQMLGGAVVWMLLGVGIMAKMINFEI